MRRVFGSVTAVVGVFLIAAAGLLHWYVAPRIEKAPTDTYDRIVSTGEGRHFVVTALQLSDPRPLETIQIAKGDPGPSTDDVAVISYFTRTVDLGSDQDVDYKLDIYGMDRVSGEAVQCCGATADITEGLTLKFPFHAQKTTYQLFDDGARAAFPARFLQEDVLDGLRVYEFQSDVPRTELGSTDLPGSLFGSDQQSVSATLLYQASSLVWIEPTTGSVIKGKKITLQWAEAEGQSLTLFDGVQTYDEATVRKHVDDAKSNIAQLKLITIMLPIWAPVAGIVLLAAGILLLVWRRRTPGTAPASEAHP